MDFAKLEALLTNCSVAHDVIGKVKTFLAAELPNAAAVVQKAQADLAEMAQKVADLTAALEAKAQEASGYLAQVADLEAKLAAALKPASSAPAAPSAPTPGA